MKRILVTGASGYIGSHTLVELVKAGYDVVGVDNFVNSSPSVIERVEQILGKKVPFMELDCADKQDFSRVFETYPDICGAIHFAAHKAVGESVDKPLKYYGNNISSLVNLLELISDREGRFVVFSSSCTVYGSPSPENIPVGENAPLQAAESPYGNTKQIAEDILRDVVKADKGMRVTALRYFNPIGAHSSALIGELPMGVPQNLIPYITQTAIGLREQLSVYGDDYNTPDGTCIRDYIHVCDLAMAHVASVKRLLEVDSEDRYEVFNVGTGKGLSVMEIIKAFIKVTGVNLPYKIVARRAGDIEQIWADPTKSNEILGWKSQYSAEEALASAWEWQKSLKS